MAGNSLRLQGEFLAPSIDSEYDYMLIVGNYLVAGSRV
jgi:hypothetical protein